MPETAPPSSPLNRPLGRPRPAPSRGGAGRLAALAGLGAAVAVLGTVLLRPRDPLGGEPVAVATIERAAPKPAPGAAPPGATGTTDPAARELSQKASAEEVEGASGVRVVRQGGGPAPGALVLRVPDAAPAPLRLAPAPDRRLTDRGRHGVLPKLGPGGERAAEVYARPAPPPKAGQPRVAVMIGGLGIGAALTAEAVGKLPEAVTLGFAPYGADLERQVARAREAGHEVVLQVPMEPFDYPDNDPGPQTLLASLPADQNLDRLSWLMSRFPGYVGVATHLGARFTAEPGALAPVLKELQARGLMVLDDGTSARSRVLAAAAEAGLPALRADVPLDAAGTPSEVDGALARLEALARERGSAVGAATALPATVERVARWARGLEARGVQLVPVSALAARRP